MQIGLMRLAHDCVQVSCAGSLAASKLMHESFLVLLPSEKDDAKLHEPGGRFVMGVVVH